MKRAAAVLLLVAGLSGCAGLFGPSSAELDRAENLETTLHTVPGVAGASVHYTLGIDQGDSLHVEITVGATVDGDALPALADAVRVAVDDADFGGSERDVLFTFTDGSEMRWNVWDQPLDVERQVADFAQWWADPRVAVVRDNHRLRIELDPAAGDTSMIAEVYTQVAASVETDDIEVWYPDAWSLASDGYEFTDERLAMAAEIAATAGVRQCSFSAEGFYYGEFLFDARCSLAEGVAAADIGPVITGVLERHGMLDDTNVALSPAGGAWVDTNVVGQVAEPS